MKKILFIAIAAIIIPQASFAKSINDLKVTIEPNISADCGDTSLESQPPLEAQYSCITRDIPITHAHIFISSQFPADIQADAFWLEFGHFLGDDAPMSEMQQYFPPSVLNQNIDEFGTITTSTRYMENIAGQFPLILLGSVTDPAQINFFAERINQLTN
jgi:hypothetical protein